MEALPPDIMSHDTFEAKILRPCFISAVRFREEPAKNGLSFFPQSTRWMVGEVLEIENWPMPISNCFSPVPQ